MRGKSIRDMQREFDIEGVHRWSKMSLESVLRATYQSIVNRIKGGVKDSFLECQKRHHQTTSCCTCHRHLCVDIECTYREIVTTIDVSPRTLGELRGERGPFEDIFVYIQICNSCMQGKTILEIQRAYGG